MNSQVKSSFSVAERARREVIIPNVISLYPPTPVKKARKVAPVSCSGCGFVAGSGSGSGSGRGFVASRSRSVRGGSDSGYESSGSEAASLTAALQVPRPRFRTEAEAHVFVEERERRSVADASLLSVPDARRVEKQKRMALVERLELAAARECDDFVASRVAAESRRLAEDVFDCDLADASVYPVWHGLSTVSFADCGKADEARVQVELARRAQVAEAELADGEQRHSEFCAAYEAGGIDEWMNRHRQRLLAARGIVPLSSRRVRQSRRGLVGEARGAEVATVAKLAFEELESVRLARGRV